MPSIVTARRKVSSPAGETAKVRHEQARHACRRHRQGSARRPRRHGGDDGLERDRGQAAAPAFSTAPAKAATRALGIETFDDGAAYERFSNLVHWGYGTGWGVARGVLRALGVGPRAATPAHFVLLWGSALYSLPKYEVAPPVT
jgi:hypothetical protein